MNRISSFSLLGLFAMVATSIAQESIFDGKSLEGWSGDKSLWSIQDGAITGKTTADKPITENSFLIWKGSLRDFELALKFRIEGGNSGIQFRSQDLGNFHVAGYQADIDSGMRYMGILYDEHGRGILSERGQKIVRGPEGNKSVEKLSLDDQQFQKSIKAGEWNTYVVRAEGKHITQTINGMTTVDFLDEDPKNFDAEGILALQIHTGPAMTVQFKDITLTDLKQEKK